MKRRPLRPPVARWFAVRDGNGSLVIVNEQGEQPLRAEDPLERLGNVHLAAAAPELADALRDLLVRAQHIISEYSGWRHRDQKFLMRAQAALASSRVPLAEFNRIAALRGPEGDRLRRRLSECCSSGAVSHKRNDW